MSKTIQMQVFNSIDPLIESGTQFKISVTQTLTDPSPAPKESGDLLKLSGPSEIEAQINGPQLKLDPADIVGVYPAPGSEESPDEFLPHIALTRRTLPWERHGPNGSTVWLALLVVAESELRSPKQMRSSPTTFVETTTVDGVQDQVTRQRLTSTLDLPLETAVTILNVPNALLPQILPAKNELGLLAHVKRTRAADVDTDVSIVICNRLPNAEKGIHIAFLVSLERADDLYNNQPTRFANKQQRTAFVVLHQWMFTPSTLGDFEAVVQAIRYQPNGGVLRFGNLPERARGGGQGPLAGGFSAALDDNGYLATPPAEDETGEITWRSPLRPFPPDVRGKGFAIRSAPEEFAQAPPGAARDYSHATAFEIGRLLALADSAVLQDLRGISAAPDTKDDMVAVNKLPQALQKPDWVVNPQWSQQPWEFAPGQPLVKDEERLLQKGVADVTGIAQQSAQWKTAVLGQLQSMGTAPETPVVEFDIQTMTGDMLNQQFANVTAAAKAQK